MRRFLALIVLFLTVSEAAGAAQTTLFDRYRRAASVAVHVAEPAGKAQGADLPGLKTALEEALVERKSIKFQLTPSPQEADIRIDAEAEDYFYADVDPIDMVSGLAAVAYDTATQEHYVRLNIRFTVTEVKSGKALWKDLVVGSITSNDLTPETAPALVNADIAKVFIRKCFGKSTAPRAGGAGTKP